MSRLGYAYLNGGGRPGDQVFSMDPEGKLHAAPGVLVASSEALGSPGVMLVDLSRDPVSISRWDVTKGLSVAPVDLSDPPVEDYPHAQRSRRGSSVWKEKRRKFQQPSLFGEESDV